jgi:HlyD family secretion protein
MTANPSIKKFILWPLVLLVVAAALYMAFKPKPVAVDLATIEVGPMTVEVGDEGRTRIREIYEVSTPVAGRVLRLESSVGDLVRKNKTVLAVVQPGDPAFLDRRNRTQALSAAKAARAALKLGEAELARTKAEYDFAGNELKRAESLAAKRNLSAQKLDRARLDYVTAGAAMATAEATMEVRRYELEQAQAALIAPSGAGTTLPEGECCVEIKAPVNGQVLRILQESETIVQAGTPLVELGNASDLEVVVDLLSTDAVKVKPGASAQIVDWGGEANLNGTVRLVEPYGFAKVSALGIEEQRVNVIIAFAPDQKAALPLGHGFRVNARITVWQEDRVVKAPLAALFRHQNKWAVFKDKAGVATLSYLELGKRNREVSQVLKGLSPGERVILHPGDRIDDGVELLDRARVEKR